MKCRFTGSLLRKSSPYRIITTSIPCSSDVQHDTARFKNHYPYTRKPVILFETMRSSANQKQQSGEHSTGYKGLTLIIILCFLGIMPLLILISLPETSTYAVVTTSSAMIQSAAAEAGLEICSQEAKSVAVQGAQSAILYQLAPD